MSDATTMNRTEYVTAFFDSEADAEAAVARIEAEGIPRDQIRVVAGAPDAGAGPDSGRTAPEGLLRSPCATCSCRRRIATPMPRA